MISPDTWPSQTFTATVTTTPNRNISSSSLLMAESLLFLRLKQAIRSALEEYHQEPQTLELIVTLRIEEQI